MGNCLKSPTSDDISLLHESQSDRASYGDGPDPDQEPPPPYQVTLTHMVKYHPQKTSIRVILDRYPNSGCYKYVMSGIQSVIRTECVICMMDFVYGDPIRFLPCMHIYHMDCIDDWLMRSFTCPSCMEPVDAALLSSYETN
uniref:RING-type domain-containing protein n=1 Tax=Monopterus albus TaxID=43700 RepID=A0A3Q3K5B7_MONAL